MPEQHSPPGIRRGARAAPAVVVVLLGGIALRAWVLGSARGTLNADEAYTGLQAADILDGRVPIVIQGSTYSAVIESYLFAPVVAMFGQHVVPLKVIPILGWALASVCIWWAVRPIAGARTAGLAATMLWLAPGAMTVVSTRAYVGYALGMAIVVTALWATERTLDGDEPDRWASMLAGAAIGLAIYIHPMYLTVVVPLSGVACVVHRRRLRSWWVPAVVGLLAVNFPFLAWNATNGWPSLEQPVGSDEAPAARLVRFFTGLLPRALGLRAEQGAWVIARPVALVLYLAVLAAACAGAWRLSRRDGAWSARGLLVVVPLLACWPLMALLSNLSFVLDARYAVIPLPFLLVAVAAGVEGGLAHVPRRWTTVAACAAVAVWVGALSIPWLHQEAGVRMADPNVQTATLIDELEARGVRRIAGYYWLVLPIEYQSDRGIRAATVGRDALVRVPSSQRLVGATPPRDVAFVFDALSDDPTLLRMPPESYTRVEVAGAILYVPRSVEGS